MKKLLAIAFLILFMAFPVLAQHYCVTDTYGYLWELDVISKGPDGVYLFGTMTSDIGVTTATGLYKSGWLSLSSFNTPDPYTDFNVPFGEWEKIPRL